jgi:hypothetical protein
MHFPLIFIKHICLDVMFARCVLDSDIVVIRIVGLVFLEILVWVVVGYDLSVVLGFSNCKPESSQ